MPLSAFRLLRHHEDMIASFVLFVQNTEGQRKLERRRRNRKFFTMAKEHRIETKQKELQAKERADVDVAMLRKRTPDARTKPGKTQTSAQYFVLSMAARALSGLEM